MANNRRVPAAKAPTSQRTHVASNQNLPTGIVRYPRWQSKPITATIDHTGWCALRCDGGRMSAARTHPTDSSSRSLTCCST